MKAMNNMFTGTEKDAFAMLYFPIIILSQTAPKWRFSFRQQIKQIDLVINWSQLKSDNISRHIRITNRLGQQEWVSISNILPLFQPRHLYFSNFRRKASGVHNNFLVKMESEILMLSTKRQDYALNKEVLRAVLNGHHVDMTQPCEVWDNDHMFGYEQMRERQMSVRSQSQKIEERSGVETGSEEDVY
jgi:hypothetical protein